MFKKMIIAAVGTLAVMSFAFAGVDVNKADQAALDSVKGIGPTMSRAILEERKKGQFKDWSDLQTRVKGIGDKSSDRFSEAGLTVNGVAKPAAGKSAVKKKESIATQAQKDVVKQ